MPGLRSSVGEEEGMWNRGFGVSHRGRRDLEDVVRIATACRDGRSPDTW
jgi:hypothetical protein